MNTERKLAMLSRWIDEGNAHRDPEAATWARLAKLAEETGEVVSAYIGATGQNPRKGVTHEEGDVLRELMDVAVTALAAAEHLTGNQGWSMRQLHAHVARVFSRAGLEL
jgi:NTP pyrophosphatase (non-canonical NTP hydrolase)